MKRYLVERTIKMSKVVEARNKAEAIDWFDEVNVDFKVTRETAKLLHGGEPKNLPGSSQNFINPV